MLNDVLPVWLTYFLSVCQGSTDQVVSSWPPAAPLAYPNTDWVLPGLLLLGAMVTNFSAFLLWKKRGPQHLILWCLSLAAAILVLMIVLQDKLFGQYEFGFSNRVHRQEYYILLAGFMRAVLYGVGGYLASFAIVRFVNKRPLQAVFMTAILLYSVFMSLGWIVFSYAAQNCLA